MRWISIPIALTVMTVACGAPDGTQAPGERSAEGDARSVYVVNYPLQYFAERIGQELVEVSFPAPGDEDPAFWSPDAAAIAAYQQADLILLNGAGYAKWMETASLPSTKLVDTSAGFRDRYLVEDSAVVHSHGPEGEHSHEVTAFTTWLDPKLAILQAQAIRDAFAAKWPDHDKTFQDGLAALESDLLELDERMASMTEQAKELPLVASHPVYQYLARRYDLNLKSVHFEPGEVPPTDAWHDLEHVRETHEAKWMLWEGEPLAATADKLRLIGLASVVFDPCGNRPGEGDYLSVMRANADALSNVFGSIAE